jgi:glycosyltransferase involved in cell wall biosynthesis
MSPISSLRLESPSALTAVSAPSHAVAQRVAIVIAAYNEGRALADVVAGLRQRYPTVVVVDDGSSDETSQVALVAGAHVLRHPINLGQGAALQTGMAYALRLGSEYIVTFDADGQHDAAEIPTLLAPLVRRRADVALGSRFLGKTVNMPRAKGFTLWLAVRFTRLTTGLRVTDTHNGFRAFTREAASKLHIRQDRMAHASEILDQISSLALRYEEVPVTITYTAYSIAKGQRIINSVGILKDQFMGRLAK